MFPQITIELNNINVAYENISAFRCEALKLTGNTIGLIGHNGAGKSTFIKTILGLLIPKSGAFKTTWGKNKELYNLIPEKHMAFCPETGSIFEDISVQSYIEFWCRLKHKDAKYFKNSGKNVIDLLNINPLLKKLGRELSKGQRRRVQTAIGFILKPKLFLFDEPFDGLDVQRSAELAQIISSYKENTCFIISSHRMEVIERLADSVLVLKEGKVFACGTVNQVCATLQPPLNHINGNGHQLTLPSLVDAMTFHLKNEVFSIS